ncbi:MAG: 30S ribosomal protein S20 [Mycoplasmataceae bacterium]|jgi:small subunit ribosomal protein S20|nr:30S ribosomal protein S20 [Mycoplasmataceae bacterium]
MANIKANIKNIRKTARRTRINKGYVTAYRSQTKKVRTTQDSKDLAKAYKTIDSVASKGKMHKNKANRLKSRLAKAVNKKQPIKINTNENKTK